MSGVRKNTLVVDFNVLPIRPDVGSVQHFLDNEIKLNLADVNSIQLHHTRNCVYIEMKGNDIAQRYEKAHNVQRSFICNDKPYKIPVYVDSEAVTVRVCDLPPSMPHVTVGNFMMRFGDVISIQNERWKNYFGGVYNGVRVLQMRLKQSIPSYITIDNQIATVLHPNQIKTCRYCSKTAHPNQKCSDGTVSKNKAKQTTTTSSPSEAKFDEADFPPMQKSKSSLLSSSLDTIPQTIAVLPTGGKRAPATRIPADRAEQNTNNDTDAENDDDGKDDSSSTPYESNDGTNKRRLSTKRCKDKKKMCAIQGSQIIDCDSN